MRTPSSRRVVPVLFTVATGVLVLIGCSDDSTESTGHDTPDEVIAAHVEAGRTYDLAAGCRLRPPDQLEVAAAADDVDLDGYCEFATADVVAMADEATKSRSEGIYTDPVIEPEEGSDGTVFKITAADGSYEEQVTVIEHDGSWYVGDIEVHIHDDDEVDHGHDDDPTDETDVDQSGIEDQPG